MKGECVLAKAVTASGISRSRKRVYESKKE